MIKKTLNMVEMVDIVDTYFKNIFSFFVSEYLVFYVLGKMLNLKSDFILYLVMIKVKDGRRRTPPILDQVIYPTV